MSYKSLKETGTAISIILYGRWFKQLFIVAFVFILFIYLIFFFITVSNCMDFFFVTVSNCMDLSEC